MVFVLVVGIDFLDNEGSALFQEHSSINHSCFPNAASVFNGNHILKLVAVRIIEPGDEINISYIAPCELEHSRHTRQKYLQYVLCYVIILTILVVSTKNEHWPSCTKR